MWLPASHKVGEAQKASPEPLQCRKSDSAIVVRKPANNEGHCMQWLTAEPVERRALTKRNERWLIGHAR